jgi:hypothetical protein
VLRIHIAAARHLLRILIAPALLLALQASAQTAPAATTTPAPAATPITSASGAAAWNGHLVLVLPFENLSTQPGLDWIGESFPTMFNARLHSAGYLTIRREARIYSLQHLGLPGSAQFTHATLYKVAQTLDADAVILGSYNVTNGTITATAHILQMHGPHLDGPLTASAPLNQLLNVEDGLAWQAARRMDPAFTVPEQAFLDAGRKLRLDTLENYMRGEIEPGAEERIRHLTIAVQLSPDYAPARLALGLAYFSNQQYDRAMDALAQVPAQSSQSLEASFYTGLAGLYTGQYTKAESAFATLAASLPLAEVLNDQGIALNREDKDGTALIARAAQLNPQNENFWFNLAVSERRAHADAKALDAVHKALALRPSDAEAQQLQQHLLVETGQADPSSITTATAEPDADPDADPSAGSGADAADIAASANAQYEPLERIARSYNETSYRQTEFELERLRTLRSQRDGQAAHQVQAQ